MELKVKKPYSKPNIFFESFQMSTSISASCEETANFSQGSCGFAKGMYASSPAFTSDVSGCVIKMQVYESAGAYVRWYDGKKTRMLCYYGLSDNYNIFNS